jgi:hypothetical protein
MRGTCGVFVVGDGVGWWGWGGGEELEGGRDGIVFFLVIFVTKCSLVFHIFVYSLSLLYIPRAQQHLNGLLRMLK